MLFQALSMRCQCGRPPMRIREVGLTANHELAVYWQCAACRRPVFAVKPLTECWNDCPKHEAPASRPLLPGPVEPDQSTEDNEFLRRMGVRPDSPETNSL